MRGRGAEWLVADVSADILTPETLSEDHRLVAQTAAEFVAQEVTPALDALEQKDWATSRTLIERAGALGLIGTDLPESVGGVGLDKAAAIVVGEAIGPAASFATTFGAQSGLVTIPLLCFGSDAQQQKYLPRIASGELIGAYCLSESGSGSDALGARAKAVKQSDGSWRLSGEKMWITNGGFADLFIVFAKVDGEQFSAFIVERGFAGVSHGKEEHKLGLHGSSTTPLVLNDAQVPADNLLGEIGKGAKIAFNVLNYGRFKLAAMCSGGAKAALAEAAGYAAARRQFGQPLTSFGAIQQKLGEMALRLYGVESMLYRTTGLIDQAIADAAAGGNHSGAEMARALEEFAVEASLLKVAGSEMIDFVIDEEVQIFGGNGFVREYPAERRFRDARVNRIFEGTNEINRLLVPGVLIKRAMKGALALKGAAEKVQAELVAPPSSSSSPASDSLAAARRMASAARKTALLMLGLAAQTYGDKLGEQQEVLMLVTDMLIDAYAADSAARRAGIASRVRPAAAPLHADAATVIAHDAAARVEASARVAIAAMQDGDAMKTSLAAVRKILKVEPVNTVAARRRIGQAVAEKRAYVFA
ncbi:MAG TPA: acyl-CoA dehydrogenase family protein [Vicinamibacterales bacterium]|nr:acyl-CoA dehydrogenase family protein [Vicinamibacterales bacterium]